MPAYKFFDSTNPYSSLQKEGGGGDVGRRVGWCAAASAIWVENILIQGLKPGDSQPSMFRAGILQVKYRWDPAGGGADILHLLACVQLTGPFVGGMFRDAALNGMTAQPAISWFRNETHAMAMSTIPARPLWYDIEQGLFEYDTCDEMKDAVKNEYASNGQVWEYVICRRRA